MTTGIVILVLVVIVVLVALGVLWDSWRSGRAFCTPIPGPYKGRGSQEAAWRDRFGGGLGDADAVLTMFCEAFGFNPDDRYKFGPDDPVMDIYKARYPRWKVWRCADEMEFESLTMDLDQQYGIDVPDWRSDITLGEIVELAAERKSNGQVGSPQ
jgi:hypothetical protein